MDILNGDRISADYRNTVCSCIREGKVSLCDLTEVLSDYIGELHRIFACACSKDEKFSLLVDKMSFVQSIVVQKDNTVMYSSGGLCGEDHSILYFLYDTLFACITAACNKDLSEFTSPLLFRDGIRVQMLKACALLVNIISIYHCFVQTYAPRFTIVPRENDYETVLHLQLALSAYLNVIHAAKSYYYLMVGVPKRTKVALSRFILHNAELAFKVSELVDIDVPFFYRYQIGHLLYTMMDTIENSYSIFRPDALTDEEKVLHLSLATEARIVFNFYMNRYVTESEAVCSIQSKTSPVVKALIGALGCVFLLCRECLSQAKLDNSLSNDIDGCITILRDEVYPIVFAYENELVNTSALACVLHIHLSNATKKLQAISLDLLLNSAESFALYNIASLYLEKASSAWNIEAMKYRELLPLYLLPNKKKQTTETVSTSAMLETPQIAFPQQMFNATALDLTRKI
ncbi:HGE-14 family type IV secretion system effector [Anaplasma phagocytophilum]|uniref:HGE-14 family type IV secretion system effector n=1 Tax=Anaplasma phagocytophilum TaxID=948 RepID=UPI00201A941D